MNRDVFIGKHIKVVQSTNAEQIGMEGTIVDETKNTFVVDGKTLIKDHAVFEIDGKEVQGKDILGRTEERIKK